MTALVPAQHAGLHLLVVDDEQANLDLMQRVLVRAGYTALTCLRDGREALDRFDELAPDLVVVDLHMLGVSGFEVLRFLAQHLPPEDYVPRLVITADATLDTRRKALALGAHDFLTKPIEIVETTLRVANLLQTRALHVGLRQHKRRLERTVRERTAEAEDARREVTTRLARLAEYRDDDTAGHTLRVGDAAATLAGELGMPADEVELVRIAAPLHDVGKVGIPDVMRRHAEIGAEILSGGSTRLLRLAETIALTHHERWDGPGYPRRLARRDIPIVGRLVAVVDVFDALTHEERSAVRPHQRDAVSCLLDHRVQHRGGRLRRRVARTAWLPLHPGRPPGVETDQGLAPHGSTARRLRDREAQAAAREEWQARRRERRCFRTKFSDTHARRPCRVRSAPQRLPLIEPARSRHATTDWRRREFAPAVTAASRPLGAG